MQWLQQLDIIKVSKYLVGPAVETGHLRGTLQVAAAALAQMLGHPGVQSGGAARQRVLGVPQGGWRERDSLQQLTAHHTL